MFQTMLRDNRQARELQPSGEYMRVRSQGKAINAQELFYRQAYEQPAARQDAQETPAAVPAMPAPAAESKQPPHLGSWLHSAMDKLKKQ